MKKIAVVALLSAVVAIPAFAADNGFYAGVTAGQSRTGNDGTGGIMTKNTDTIVGLLGGYQYNQNLGAELFYSGAGKAAGCNAALTQCTSGKTDAWGVNAVGTLPLSDAFSLYGKLGYARTKSSLAVPAGSTYAGTTRGAATYGIGGIYNVTPAIGVRFGWDRYGAATINGVAPGVKNNYNFDTWTLGAVFRF